jgi:S-adenosylhomocysteine hydrolase
VVIRIGAWAFCLFSTAVLVVALAALVDQARAGTRSTLSAKTQARAAVAAVGTEHAARGSEDRARLPLWTGNAR